MLKYTYLRICVYHGITRSVFHDSVPEANHYEQIGHLIHPAIMLIQ